MDFKKYNRITYSDVLLQNPEKYDILSFKEEIMHMHKTHVPQNMSAWHYWPRWLWPVSSNTADSDGHDRYPKQNQRHHIKQYINQYLL